jgi:hypothetical protein
MFPLHHMKKLEKKDEPLRAMAVPRADVGRPARPWPRAPARGRPRPLARPLVAAGSAQERGEKEIR